MFSNKTHSFQLFYVSDEKCQIRDPCMCLLWVFSNPQTSLAIKTNWELSHPTTIVNHRDCHFKYQN